MICISSAKVVMHGRRTCVRSPIDDAHVSLVHQRLNRTLENGAQAIVYRAHFQEHHAAFLEYLRERVGQRNGRHVASSQDDSRFRGPGTGPTIMRGKAIAEILAVDAILHPSGHFEREEREPVVQDAGWQQGNAKPPIRSLVCLAGKLWEPRVSIPRSEWTRSRKYRRVATGPAKTSSARCGLPGGIALARHAASTHSAGDFHHSLRALFCKQDSLPNRSRRVSRLDLSSSSRHLQTCSVNVCFSVICVGGMVASLVSKTN